MALLTTRQIGCQLLRRQPSCMVAKRSQLATRPTAFEEMGRYWEKNKALGRPLSPHLTVFKPHMTMMISITNRVAAVALTGGLTLGSIGLLCVPSGDYTSFLRRLRDIKAAPVLINGIKVLIALPFAYHLVAGGRHLIWDMGYGFSKPATRKGGVVVLALTALLTAILVFGVKPPQVQGL